jgi:biopolymer transport protein ExbB
MSYLLMVIVFSIERAIVIGKASGTGNVDVFVKKIQSFLNAGNIDAASAECDKQKGSVANVIKSGLKKYKEMEAEPNLDVDQKTLAIQKDIEEATALEMPMLEQNLTIIATLVSIGTLTGLLGTVIGMIKAFGALAASGAPNQSALSNSISEALINTALGIVLRLFQLLCTTCLHLK